MITRLLIFLCAKSPLLRRALWRWWYGKLAKQIAAEEWTFMNYGFAAVGSEAKPLQAPELKAEDEADRYCIHLYERVASGAELAGKQVLEIGSGRGGGASYISRYHAPATMIGVDFSSQATAFSQKRHDDVAGLEFVTGDAENLPFEDASFDVVINVESSHCYGNIPKFIAEAIRVLRPGGHFVFADMRDPQEAAELIDLFKASSQLRLVEQEDITPGVMGALGLDDARKRTQIEDLVSEGIRPMFEEFAGLNGGKIQHGFDSGSLVYIRLTLEKTS